MSKDDAISIIHKSILVDEKSVLYFFLLDIKKSVNAIPFSATPLKKLIIRKGEM